tara:strand:- start:510 stop:791 length:282 start_codon:yes stop_codon:yes gene_type:complete
VNVSKDLTYILRIQEPTKNVLVEALGMNRVDAEVAGWYPSTEALPTWIQEKLVLLMMLEFAPNGLPHVSLDGVGSKFKEDKFEGKRVTYSVTS